MSKSTSQAPLLELRNLTRRFGDRTAVDRLSLTLQRGEIVGLLGPNGAGKSTAFNLLTGGLKPDAGEILLNGAPARVQDRDYRARLGVVFQEPSLDKRLSGRQNLMLHAALHGVSGAAAKQRVAESLDLIGLSDRADEAVDRYSGGMKRRLDLGRVLLHGPELMIMDEPTVGLDEASFQRLWTHLRGRAAKQELTILLTTHKADEASQCDRLAILDSGKVIASGSPEELTSRIRGDVLVVEAAEIDELAAAIAERFDLQPEVVQGRARIECQEAHTWIPRIVEAFPAGRIQSMSVHRPTLADVFTKMAGRSLDA